MTYDPPYVGWARPRPTCGQTSQLKKHLFVVRNLDDPVKSRCGMVTCSPADFEWPNELHPYEPDDRERLRSDRHFCIHCTDLMYGYESAINLPPLSDDFEGYPLPGSPEAARATERAREGKLDAEPVPPTPKPTTYHVRTTMDEAVDRFWDEYVEPYGYLPFEVLAALHGHGEVFVSRVLRRAKELSS